MKLGIEGVLAAIDAYKRQYFSIFQVIRFFSDNINPHISIRSCAKIVSKS